MSPSPQPDPQSNIEQMLGDPDFHQLEGPEQRQLLRNAGMGDRSDQELDSLVMAARNYHGMSPGQVMSPVSKFLGSAGQAIQSLPYAGESMLHMIGGPDPTTGETTADWFNQLPGVVDYNRLRQGQIAEELGSLVPMAGLSLLTGGVARAPEVAQAAKTGAGVTWAGLKGGAKAYSLEKTGIPATAMGALLHHLEVPYGAEIGGVLGAAPSIVPGVVRGIREYLNPPFEPLRVGPIGPVEFNNRYGQAAQAAAEEAASPAKRATPVPPVYYPPKPGAPPVKEPPPVVYRQPPAAGPVKEPPPVVYRQEQPPPATGAPKRAPIGPLQFKNRFWTAPEEGGEGEGMPPPAGPKKTMTPEEERSDTSAALHGTFQELDLGPESGPGKNGHPVIARLARELGRKSSKDFTAQENRIIDGLTQQLHSQGQNRPPTAQEILQAFQNARK